MVYTTEEQDYTAALRTYRMTRDPALRNELITAHLHLVHHVARRFFGLGESLEDLLQEGTIGLMNAIDVYDPDRGVRFSTYANHLVTGHIQHYLRDQGRLIRQPAWIQELNTRVLRVSAQIEQELGREPLPLEIATRLNVSEKTVLNILATRKLNYITSLTAPGGPDGDGDPLSEKEKLHNRNEPDLSLPVEDRLLLNEAIQTLKPIEQTVVQSYFFGDLSQTEIARQQGISVNYSCYLLRRAIAKIKVFFEEQEEDRSTMTEAPPIAANTSATFDPLTGTYSEAYFRSKVGEEIMRSQKNSANFALMFAQMRHVSGDESMMPLISALSQRIRNTSRIVDSSAYLGHGRFGLLLPQTGRQARVLGERLCTQWDDFRQKYGIAISYSIAFGFAVYPLDGDSVHRLFSQAERALGLPT